MRKQKPSFYFFVATTLLLSVLLVWWLIARMDESTDVHQTNTPQTADKKLPAPEANKPTSRQAELAAAAPAHAKRFEMLDDSLREGYAPTQELGETGSLLGVLDTNYPMVYADTKYERIKGSPLIRFTDDMIWRDGEAFIVKRDAMFDQANHIQETSIALSISPRIELGQTTGYRIVEIPDGTLFTKLGLLPGDVIVDINGMHPDTEQMALMFVNMVAGKQGRTKVTIESRGKKRILDIRAAE